MKILKAGPRTADEALALLRAGNTRFVNGQARFPTVQKEVLAELALGQQPYATIIGCADSRVPPELVFDAGFGQLFVIRVAGNVYSEAVMGSLQYAKRHLHTRLFVVLGHHNCGAVQAAVAMRAGGEREAARIAWILDGMMPGLEELDPNLASEALHQAAVEANVRWTMRQILETPEGQTRFKDGTLKLVGAVYDLETGAVRFLE